MELSWDAELPPDLARRWQGFRDGLRALTILHLPRWLHSTPSSPVQLHAFADASRRAIAAAVYLRAETETGTTHVSLVMSKTKLSPIRSLPRPDRAPCRMTIPRLELRAALLAVRLLHLAARDLGVPSQDCHAWSDSRVVLHWLHSKGPLDNDLVDNYVTQIHEAMPRCPWRYVRTTENPADVATRGSEPSQLNQHRLWWSGPSWLSDPVAAWPVELNQPPPPVFITTCVTLFDAQSPPIDVSERFSNLDRLLRALVHCRRLSRSRTGSLSSTVLSPITADELDHELLQCIRRSQEYYFAVELDALRANRPVPRASPLKSLCPFIDDSKLLRVQGRLENSALPFSEQHPPILHGQCRLSALLIDWAHTRALHGGFRVTYAYTMQRDWIIGGKVRVKAHIRRCVVCARSLARPSTQVMAPLPAARVTPSRPFSRCGVDYAGPFQLLSSKGRRRSLYPKLPRCPNSVCGATWEAR